MTCLLNRTNMYLSLGIALLVVSCKQKQPEITQEDYTQRSQQMVEINKLLLKKDKQRILGYIERHQLSMEESATGLWYGIEYEGTGTPAESGRIITLKYTLSLLDGTVCYSSAVDGLKSFKIGRGGVESGLEEAVLMLNAGARAKFILPPHLAHGLPGDGNKIPARAIIIYDLEVLSIE